MPDAPVKRPIRTNEAEHEDQRWVRCCACAEPSARASDRVLINGGELHTFVNPQGEVFELACFSQAPGARASGQPSLAFTWFPGHSWRFALCQRCGAQLGWRYEGPQLFWGLIRARLVWP